MASISTSIPVKLHQFCNSHLSFRNGHNKVLAIQSIASFNLGISQKGLCNERSLYTFSPIERGSRCLSKPVSAGLEASITDAKDNGITLKKAKIVVESQDDDKILVRVDVTGEETQKVFRGGLVHFTQVFNQVLRNLARTAPPIPGFRRDKGGKTTNVPTDFLLQILGEERVTKFVIQEIVSSSMADYVKKENLNVKENKITTSQTAEELKGLFTPGNEFSFNATLELEKLETETDSSEESSEF